MIGFNDLHDKMIQVTTKLISRNDFYAWLDENILPKAYIPIKIKYSIISNISEKVMADISFISEENRDIKEFYMNYDINSTIIILLSYTDIEYKKNNLTSENYDLMHNSGFYNYMMRFCKRDYIEFKNKCDLANGIESIRVWYDLNKNLMNLPSAKDFDKSLNKVKKMFNDPDFDDTLNNLLKIEMMNNPRTGRVVDTLFEKK